MSPVHFASIVHVMGWPSQQYGSFERFLVTLAESCAAAGAETHLVFTDPPASRDFVRDCAARIHALASPRGPWDPRFAARLARLLRRTRATHVHAHYGPDAYQAVAVARLSDVHRRLTTKHQVPSGSALSAMRHRWLAAQVDTVFAVSFAVGEQLISLGVPREKVDVCHLGVDARAYRRPEEVRARSREALGVAPGQRVVLSTSLLRPGKGVEVLPRLADELDDALVLAAGGGPLRERLELMARRLELSERRFRLLGVRADVPELLAAADLFVLPTSQSEGFPLGVIEAVAAGVPVVASNLSDLGRVLGGAALLVAPGDAEALIAACRTVLDQPGLAASLRERGKALAANELDVRRAAEHHVRTYLE